jgi:hypothetical protein
MYSHEGFIPLTQIAAHSEHLAHQFWANRVREKHYEHEGKIDKELARELFFERSLLGTWIIAKALFAYEVFLCSPDNRRVVAAFSMLRHEDQLSWYDWSWPIREHDELSGPLSRALEEGDRDRALYRFRYIDVDSGSISIKGREDKIRVNAAPERVETAMAVASQFEGWSVCMRIGDFPDSDEGLAKAVGLDGPRVVHSERYEQRGPGRPRLQDDARGVYELLYPEGHGSARWKTVENEVTKALGKAVSARTIKRSIGQKVD